MSGFRRPAFLSTSLRRGLAMLALLAVSALLLRPVCDALEPLQARVGQAEVYGAGHGHDHPQSCCATLSDGALLSGAPAVLASASAGEAAPPAVGPSWLPPRPYWHAAVDPPRHPPRSLRYHARTARILA